MSQDEQTYLCPEGEVVGAEHFLSGECPTFPPALFAMLVHKERTDLRHKLPQVTTTSIYACPTALALKRLDAGPIIVERLVARGLGTAVHGALETAGLGVETIVTESCTCASIGSEGDDKTVEIDQRVHYKSCGKALCTFIGTLRGRRVSGRVDFMAQLEDGTWLLGDYKNRSPLARRYHDYPSDDETQAYINMELARQSGLRVAQYAVYVFYQNEVMVKRFTPLDDVGLQELFAVPPAAGGDATLAECLEEAHAAVNVTSVEEALTVLPKRGPERFNGKMCAYCEFESVCFPTRRTEV